MRSVLVGLVLLATAIGCATPPPPRPLLDARAAYNKARMGQAAQLAPAELHTAKVALNAAEESYQEDAESAETFALSYVALRKAQHVESLANTKAAEAQREQVNQELNELQLEEMRRARGELAKTKQELAVSGEQLEAERKAREAAEARAKDAMRRLAEIAALSIKEEKRGTVIVLPGSVLFAVDKYELTPGAQQKLALIADTLAPQAERHDIVIEGHTDSRGSREHNMLLAQNRAEAVRTYLVSRGVPAEAVKAVGIGPDRPVADNSTREGRQQNRRVEIIVQPMKK
jgi:outer membrane protein OmpA-like peptidoglycan-associated protein